MADTLPKTRIMDYLDAVLVISSVLLLGGVIYVLAYVHVPQENLPILASLATGIFGSVVSGYIGFRWGSSESAKRSPPSGPAGTVTASISATTEAEPKP